MANCLYFIAIEIPEPYKSEMQGLKEELSVKYRATHALKTPPHITLQMPMRIEEEKESEMVQNLSQLNGIYPSGTIKLNNISCFPSRTIFIDVISEGLVCNLFDAVNKQVKTFDFINDKITIPSFHPHITLLTRDLNKTMYHLAFNALNSTKFEQEIEIDAFQLYRHNGKSWKVIETIKLGTKKCCQFE